MQGNLKARAAQARALERHWDVTRAHTRQSNLGQGTTAFLGDGDSDGLCDLVQLQ